MEKNKQLPKKEWWKRKKERKSNNKKGKAKKTKEIIHCEQIKTINSVKEDFPKENELKVRHFQGKTGLNFSRFLRKRKERKKSEQEKQNKTEKKEKSRKRKRNKQTVFITYVISTINSFYISFVCLFVCSLSIFFIFKNTEEAKREREYKCLKKKSS